MPRTRRYFVTVTSRRLKWKAETQMESFFRVPSKVSSGIGASSIWHCLSAANLNAVRFAAPLFLVAVLLSAHSPSVGFWLITLVAYVVHPKQISMAVLQQIALGSMSCFRVKSANTAVEAAPFGRWRWTLRDKASRSAPYLQRWGYPLFPGIET